MDIRTKETHDPESTVTFFANKSDTNANRCQCGGQQVCFFEMVTPTVKRKVTEPRRKSKTAALEQRLRRAGVDASVPLLSDPKGDLAPEIIADIQRFVSEVGAGYPLILYGGSIFLRRQTLHAIGRELLSAYPDTSLRCVTICDYLDQMTKANQQRRDRRFLDAYLKLDAFLLEAMECFTMNSELEESIFLTAGALAKRGRWVVMTCAGDPLRLEFKTRYARDLVVFANRVRSQW